MRIERAIVAALLLLVSACGGHAHAFGSPGFLVRRHVETHRLYVRVVAPAVHGIVEGDELVGVDDDDATVMSDLELDRRLRGAPRSTLRVRVRREGEEREVVIERLAIE